MAEQETAKAVGDIPSGLFIVCAQNDGFLASWIQQVSFQPLLVSLCVKAGRPACDHILKGETFSINVVGEHDKSYLKHFWSGYSPDDNPLEKLPHQRSSQGGLVLDAAKSAMVCRQIKSYQPGDHHLVVAEVLASMINAPEAQSMVHLRKSGLDY